jgi:cephalosporin-C deacetylase-like acetyl esterase
LTPYPCIWEKILLLAIWLVCWQAAFAQQSKLDFARQLLNYDPKLPLDVKEVTSFERGGVNVQDITFASPKSGRVSAYLVAPVGSKDKHAGVVFGHWGNGNRAEFLPEALLLAEAGVVSILIDYPWERPAPWWRDMPPLAEPEKRMELYAQALIDLRRAIDLLLARSDVDPKRIGYVGHSYGAQWGAILAAIDKRMKAAVLMAGVPTAASLWLEATGDAILSAA